MHLPIYLRALLLLLSISPVGVAAELLACGSEEVYILDVSDIGQPKKTFSWRAQDRAELPTEFKDKFRTTDECKLVSGNRVLITASSNGVALVERSSGETLFWGVCRNAHSADLLPSERIAVACSVGEGGNRLVVFDAKTPGKELFSTELVSGHGAVWDSQRKLLWALSGADLRTYSLVHWDSNQPSLKLESQYPLPSKGGHELSAVPDSNFMIVSANAGAWLFDRESHSFETHRDLGGMRGIKSATKNAKTGQLAFTQSEPPNWWTSEIRMLNPEANLIRESERLYKVRWID